MKRGFVSLGIALMLIMSFIAPFSAVADVSADNTIKYLNIATTDTRPIAVDRLVYTALRDIGYHVGFTSTTVQLGYEMADSDSGEMDGVLSILPNMEEIYRNLRKVPVPVETLGSYVYVRTDSGLKIDGWSSLSGLKVGVLPNVLNVLSKMPGSAEVDTRETTKQIIDGLVAGEFDAAILFARTHEMISNREGIKRAASLDTFEEYLYLHKNHEDLIPNITGSMEAISADGRWEAILNYRGYPDMSPRKTILHIVSSNLDVQREDQFYARLRENFRLDDSIEWYPVSLNARSLASLPGRLTNIAQTLKQDCVSRDVVAIVVSGEEALQFLSAYYLLLFRNTPVIFFGTDLEYTEHIRDFNENFTGIIEKVSAGEVAALAMRLFPDTRNIYVVNDYTSQGTAYRKNGGEQLKQFEDLANITYSADAGRDEMLAKIRELPKDSIVLTGSYYTDSNGQYYSQNEMKRVFESNCKVPLFTIYSMSPGYNAIGGKFPDYGLYADTVTEMLKHVFSGGDVSDIPVVTDSSDYNRWVFDKDVMDYWGVKGGALPQGATVINSVPSIWESDPKFAITLIMLVVVSISAVAGINIFVMKYRRQREDLHTAEQLIEKDQSIREIKERLESIIKASPIAYALCIDGLIVEINESMKRNTGLDKGGLFKSVHANPEECDYYYEKIMRDGVLNDEIVKFKFTDGMEHRCIFNAVATDYEGKKGAVIWLLDIELRESQRDELHSVQLNLQAILDAMPAPVSIVAVETMSMVYGNEAYLKLMEYDSIEQLYGVMASDTLCPVQENGAAAEICNSLAHAEGTKVNDIQVLTSKGKTIFTRFVTRQIDYMGEKSVIGITTDLSKEIELEKSRQNLQTILDMLPAPVSIVNASTLEIIYGNETYLKVFNCDSFEEIAGRSAYEFMPEVQMSGQKTTEIVDVMHQFGKDYRELQCIKITGEPFYARVTVCMIDYKGTPASLAIVEDLTAEKEYQDMLLSAAEKEREANQLKGRFLVNMSHEIRTPMNAIIGLTEIELRKSPQKETREIYRKINNSAKNLLQIINDILDLSKIEADKIELFNQEFELEEVVSSALLVASPHLDGKNVEFMLNASLDLPRFIVGDRTRLWQILKNFLDNSAKYTEKGKIVLSVFENRKLSDDKMIYISFIVEDTGIGLSDEQMRRLFMPYEQFYSEAQKKYTGTGLGMAISKQLCEIMGGSMDVESVVGQGTTIFITIPFERSQNPETECETLGAMSLKGASILAVDDDQVSLEIMSNLIKSGDARCALAHSGTEAMEIILRQRDMGKQFDLILLDYMMNGLNGLETARQIQTSLSKSPKLLMVTAYQRMLLKDDLAQNGIEDVIEKPFIPSQFIGKLRVALGYDGEADNGGEQEFFRYDGAHVLLCEDYYLNQEVAIGMLEHFGITATVAENGKEGVEILRKGQETFDLIFMDLQMPVMDGYEATRLIRADHKFDHIPIISLTADAMTEIVDKCIETGMNDHVAKPIEFTRLSEIFAKWLQKRKRAVKEEEQSAPPSRNEGLMRFGGNRELYEKALVDLAGDIPDRWPEFDSILDDPEWAVQYVHRLKGASGNLDIKDLYNCAVQFENSLRASAPDKDLYLRLVYEGNSFKKRTELETRNRARERLGTGTAEEFHERLDELRKALENYDPKASTKAVGALKEKHWPTDGPRLEHLCELALKYDFEAAVEALEELKEYM